MSDVSVNIRGRDDGLGQTLDSLRDKAGRLGMDVERLNNVAALSPSNRNTEIREAGRNTIDTRQQEIRDEYDAIRRERDIEQHDMRGRASRQEISSSEFDRFNTRFEAENDILDQSEQSELIEVEREVSKTLRDLIKELQEARKRQQNEDQNDVDEFGNRRTNSGGSGGGGGTSNRTRQDDDDDEEKKPGQDLRTIGRIGGEIGTGNLVGAAMDTPDAMKSMGASAKAVGYTAGGLGILYGIYEFLNMGEKLKENLAPLAAMRGVSGRGGSSNDVYRSSIDPDGMNAQIGMDDNEMAQAMVAKARASQITTDLRTRTFKDQAFNKGFGADVSGFSEFERFGSKESSSVGLDILNVLTEIKESSLKSDDFATLTEKIQSTNTVLGIQRQKRDIVDTDSALKLLSAFESIGLSGKGNRGGEFLGQTIQGLGEGGSDNLMMLKFEAAKRARPDLANNPAALRRMIKFNSDDPDYMNESFKMMGQLSGGDEMAMDDMLYSYFPGLNEKDMNIYKKAIKGGNFSDLLKGKDLDKMKNRKPGLGINDAVEDTAGSVGYSTELKKDFTNLITEASSGLLKFLSGMSEDGAMKVKDISVKKATNMRDTTIKRNSTQPK